jgi:hypothetical protein
MTPVCTLFICPDDCYVGLLGAEANRLSSKTIDRSTTRIIKWACSPPMAALPEYNGTEHLHIYAAGCVVVWNSCLLEGGKRMGLSVCPAAVVAAPVESVWELLSEPTHYDEWWDARAKRIVPEGKASPGQVLYAMTSGLGRTWDVTLRVEMVNPERHQIRMLVTLPLGILNHTTITCTSIDAASCRVEFG